MMPWTFAPLANLYWRLRDCRNWNAAKRRRMYRLIAVERKRLVDSGQDVELVRLACRHLANPLQHPAERRFRAALASVQAREHPTIS
jgi:hypothetical protein